MKCYSCRLKAAFRTPAAGKLEAASGCPPAAGLCCGRLGDWRSAVGGRMRVAWGSHEGGLKVATPSQLKSGFGPQLDPLGIINTHKPLLHFRFLALGTHLDRKRPKNWQVVSKGSIRFDGQKTFVVWKQFRSDALFARKYSCRRRSRLHPHPPRISLQFSISAYILH